MKLMRNKTFSAILKDTANRQHLIDCQQAEAAQAEFNRRRELDAAEIKKLLADNHSLRTQIGSKR
ncbi:MAG TPA: hypothetical protein HPP87_07245 [Planctomycetes bacterium]|nr:hypothetical protein [Planctomycetota bacterium]